MATIQKAIKVGSSIAAVLPKEYLKEAEIKAGTRIKVALENGTITVRSFDRQGKKKRDTTDEEKVASTALSLMKRYEKALKQLSDA